MRPCHMPGPKVSSIDQLTQLSSPWPHPLNTHLLKAHLNSRPLGAAVPRARAGAGVHGAIPRKVAPVLWLPELKGIWRKGRRVPCDKSTWRSKQQGPPPSRCPSGMLSLGCETLARTVTAGILRVDGSYPVKTEPGPTAQDWTWT